MLIKIQGIGEQKLEYKDHSNIEFESLDSYLLLAKKSISKFANGVYCGLAKKMLKDEDAIASVANAIMMADWRWDENYVNQQGTKKTKYSYRNQCALWAIQTYVTKNCHKPKKIKNVWSLDHEFDSTDGLSVHDCVADSSTTSPEDMLLIKEKQEEFDALMISLLSLNCITDRQKEYIKLYYFEDMTFEQIGQKYNITREAVRQGLHKAIETIRSLVQ